MTTNGTTARADVNSPVFMIQHLAQLFGVRIDSVREYTYRTDFPRRFANSRPAAVGTAPRCLEWFRGLPKLNAAARKRLVARECVCEPTPGTPAQSADAQRLGSAGLSSLPAPHPSS